MVTKVKKSFAWSISRLSDFEQCPQKYKFKVIDKIPEPKNKYMERGIAIHTQGENYLKGEVKKVPDTYVHFAEDLKRLKKLKAVAEGQLAFTRNWNQTGWFDNDCWLRIKMDVHYLNEIGEAVSVDFKTGRVKPYPDQERLYGLGTLLIYPETKVARVQFWFLDHGETLPKTGGVYRRSTSMRGMQNEFTVRAARVEREKKFQPKPGAHCQWCAFSKKKSGPCKAG